MNVLGVGTDITECLRIAQMIERHGELFIDRVYTPLEIEYCRSRRMATQHFAGRWAAKEAVMKALGTGFTKDVGWTDIEVLVKPSGQPHIQLHGPTRNYADGLGVGEIMITISHTHTFATATAIALPKNALSPGSL